MGAFRDDREALLARITSLEQALAEKPAADDIRDELEALRTRVTDATRELEMDRAALGEVGAKIDALLGRTGGAVPQALQANRSRLIVLAGGAVIMAAFAVVALERSQGSTVELVRAPAIKPMGVREIIQDLPAEPALPMPPVSPTISTVSPTLGPAGQWVYVHGTGFGPGTTISVGGVGEVQAYLYDSQSLGFSIPSNAAGSTRVVVTTPAGQASSAVDFTVAVPTAPPTATGFSPSSGAPGDWIYVEGNAFVHGQTTVDVPGVQRVPVHVYSPNSFAFTVPELALGEGPLTVRTPNGAATSAGDFHVVTADAVVETGHVFVNPVGGWANVYTSAGRFLCQTPCRAELPAGSQRLHLRPSGQPPAIMIRVNVEAGRSTSIRPTIE